MRTGTERSMVGSHRVLFAILAVPVAIAHSFIVLKAVFVSNGNEPDVFWIMLLTGPASTLPATLLVLIGRRMFGGIWLILGGVASLVSASSIDDLFDWLALVRFALLYSLPMITLGAISIRLRLRGSSN